MGQTKIEWTSGIRADGSVIPGYTANTWWGCTKVSDGCKNCYAEGESARRGYTPTGFHHTSLWGPRGSRRMMKGVWNEVRKWAIAAAAAGERRRVFWGSMMDVCEDRPELVEPRKRFCGIIEELEDLDFLILTKRPENYLRLMPWGDGKWPANAWAGTSAENQTTYDVRMQYLLGVQSPIRWISAEPLLGAIDCCFGSMVKPAGEDAHSYVRDFINWVIIGGESGPGARPFDVAWGRSIMQQCKRAGVACFVKQLGKSPIITHCEATIEHPKPLRLKDAKGGDMSEWPEDLRVREFPQWL